MIFSTFKAESNSGTKVSAEVTFALVALFHTCQGNSCVEYASTLSQPLPSSHAPTMLDTSNCKFSCAICGGDKKNYKMIAVLFHISFIRTWWHNLQTKTFFVIDLCQSSNGTFHGTLVCRNGFTYMYKGKMLVMTNSSTNFNAK